MRVQYKCEKKGKGKNKKKVCKVKKLPPSGKTKKGWMVGEI